MARPASFVRALLESLVLNFVLCQVWIYARGNSVESLLAMSVLVPMACTLYVLHRKARMDSWG